MKAALRTGYYLLTGEDARPDLLQLEAVRGMDYVKEASLEIAGIVLKVAVVHGIPNIEPLLKKLEEDDLDYDFIEVMNCREGCIGGGQPLGPIGRGDETRQKRIFRFYQKDRTDKVRTSYQNREVKAVYQSFLEKPLSKLSEKLLHTYYESKHDILGE